MYSRKRRRPYYYRPRKRRRYYGFRKKLKYLYKLTRPEKKYCDTYIYYDCIAGTVGNFYALDVIGVGSSFNQRVGYDIKAKSLYFNLGYTGTSHGVELNFRVIIIMDRENDGTNAPTMSNVLQSASTAPAGICSPLNVTSCKGRFKVLYDKIFYKPVAATGTANVNSVIIGPVKVFIPLKSNIIKFKGDLGTDASKNSIWYGVINNSTGTVRFFGWTRLIFTD